MPISCPKCDSCCCGGSVESFSCEDSCSACVGTQCTRFSFTESWKDTYGLVDREYCFEITRGKDKGRIACQKMFHTSSGGIDHCQLFIDGEECAWCEYQYCAGEGEYRMMGECTNLYSDSTVNECSVEYNGIFDSFFRFDVEDTINCNVGNSNTGGGTGGSAAPVCFSQSVWSLIGILGIVTFGSIIA